MKRKLVCLLLAANVVLSNGGMTVFGADAEDGAVETSKIQTQVLTMNFTGEVIHLSLEQAIERMQTDGLRAQAAEINKQSDEAIKAGYAETVSSITRLINKYSEAAPTEDGSVLLNTGGSTIDQKIAKLQREFATDYLESNHQAELNAIEKETIETYYNVLLAQDRLKAAEDYQQNQKDILATTNAKHDAGLVAKVDVLNAENGVIKAENQVLSLQNSLTREKMNFNTLLGYPLMQNVAFTDSLIELPAPTITLQSAIENALVNRLEVPEAALALELNQILLDNLGLTISRASSTYKNKQIEVLSCEQKVANMPTTIEQDVRNNYLEIQTRKDDLATAKDSLALAEETYRIALISYEAGKSTLNEVQEAQQKVFQANLDVAQATLNYDMAIYAYDYAQGVGIERIKL